MMKTNFRRIAIFLNFLWLIVIFAPFQTISQTTNKLTPRQIAQQSLPSTVLLVMGNGNTKKIKSGSGFFVAEDIVATNFHVIKDTTEGYAKIYGQEKIYKVLGTVGIDEKNDLALLKISGIKGKPLKLNTDDSIAIGDDVYAVGNPEGLEGTFSQGIVSSIRKTDKFNLLQITASISEGSSGGAVLNDKAEVVGVAVGAIESGQSLNFAIPVSFLRSLISNKKTLVALSGNTAVSSADTQSNSNKIVQKPNKFPTINLTPKKESRMPFKIPDLVEENLFGNVKSVKRKFYVPIKKFDEWILGEPVSTTVINYNSNGYKESSEGIIYSYGWIWESEFSVHLMFMHIKKTLGFPAIFKGINSYDYSNNMVTEATYLKCPNCKGFGSDYELVNKFLIKYEKDVETRFRPDGEMFLKTIRERENQNKIIELRYDGDGTLLSKEIIYENRSGKIKELWYPLKTDKSQLELSSKTTTTETKNEAKEIYNCIKNKDAVCGRVIIKDKTTNLIISLEYANNFLKYEYEFDSNNNWTRKTEYRKVTKFGETYFEPTNVTTQEISYY